MGPSLALAAVFCLFAAPVASAATDHPLLSTIAGEDIGIGQELQSPCGIAIDDKGNTYVADYYQDRILIFSPSQELLMQLNGVEQLDGPCDMAVDSAGNLYVNNWHQDVVRFTPSVDGTTYGPAVTIDSNQPTGVTVDPDTDRVYVDDREYIAVYDPTGAPVLDGGEPLRIGLGSLINGYGITISGFEGNANAESTAGRLYVADAGDETIKVYDPLANPSPPIDVIEGGGTFQGEFHLADSDLVIDSADGHLYISDNLQPGFERPQAVVDEFSPSGHYRGSVPTTFANGGDNFLFDAEPSGLAVRESRLFVTSGNHYLSPTSGNFRDDFVYIFGPPLPSLTQILTVAKVGSGTGTVTSIPPGVGCGSVCEGEFDQGSSTQLIAKPAAGSSFAGWSGCDKPGNSCVVKMSADRAVTAAFVPAPEEPPGPPSGPGEGASAVPSPGPIRRPPAVTSNGFVPASGSLRLVRLAVKGARAVLKVAISSPGALRASGKGVRRASALPLAPGAVTLRLRLNDGGRRTLSRTDGHTLTVKLALSLTPFDGGAPASATKTVSFRASHGKQERR